MSHRIVFMGTPEFAVKTLDSILSFGYNVVGVVTVPDKPSGRGQKVTASAVKNYALAHNLPLLQPTKLKDPSFLQALAQWNADLQVVVAFRMLPKEVFSMPRFGTINLHASLLPEYRGAAPINWVIINGEQQTGVTTFFLNEHTDEGDIIEQRTVSITPDDNAETLHDKLMNTGAELVLSSLPLIFSEKTDAKPQAHNNFPAPKHNAPKIFKTDCRISWLAPPENIINFIRGLSPYPTAFIKIRRSEQDKPVSLKIFKAGFTEKSNILFCHKIESDGKTFARVAVQNGYVYLHEVQQEGKKQMDIATFLRGCNLSGWEIVDF